MKNFPVYRQFDAMDCGPTSLQIIAKYFGVEYSLDVLRDKCFTSKVGVNLLGISQAAESIGFRTLSVKVEYKKLKRLQPFPCILHWNQNHFVVLYKVRNNRYYISDPAHGKVILEEKEFIAGWQGKNAEGVALLLEPTEQFYNYKRENNKARKSYTFLWHYIKPYKRYIFQLILGMLAGSGIALIFPFLMQHMVDNGINKKNLNLVHIILISQLVIFAGSVVIELIRSWLLLHINSRINIAIISDFLKKLMNLPIRFFDTKLVGDIKQRISDHNRIQSFLTGTALSTLFSIVNLVTFTIVLSFYSINIMLFFFAFSIMSIGWILLFLKRRKQLDYIRFQRNSENESTLVELITGMQEIKLNNSENVKRWNWERIQAKLYDLNIKSLTLGQYQQIGSSTINQFKNILISYIAATQVIADEMSLGMMMSISYIIGQLNGPVQSLLGFIQSAQDAKISLDRLSEIHNKEDEERQQQLKQISTKVPSDLESNNNALILDNISFQYGGPNSPYAVKNIDITIPLGSVTAIVGMSGSGKTTLMKLLLGYYEPTSGSIRINGENLSRISPTYWRSRCGIVMQDGYIFSDTIARNIGMADEVPDAERVQHAVDVANIQSFIEKLPQNYNTVIGNSGVGISAGQRQRLLIARAVYKNPDFIFLDEATSALDAHNEKIIMENLQNFYNGKTVLIIAHRLSTVKNADQIIVLQDGEIIEVGTHDSLVQQQGQYFNLVKNQLEIAV